MTIRVGINGFGRIGRVATRALLNCKDIELVHVNDLTDTKTLSHLLAFDSVHGRLAAKVESDEKNIYVNGKAISVSAIKDPAELPWKDKKVDIVFEATGAFTDREKAELHLKAGAGKVLISAPAKGEDITVVYGVNHEKLKADHRIVSNGSCTTNCLAPVAKVLHENWKINSGIMTTVHSYTNDQRILDLPHKDLRRARAGAMNMIPTSTGAAKAIGLVLPELKGLLQGISVRVPTPNVSLVDLTVSLDKATTVDAVNKALKQAAEGNLKGIMNYSEQELVSIDYNGDPASSTVDARSTMMSGDRMVKVLSWYDNETGFSHRMIDIARLMAR